MDPSEEIPLWNILTHPLARVLDFAFGCRHNKLSRVFAINDDSYRVCCDWGATFGYSWETMSIRPRRRFLSALGRLQLRPGRLLRRETRVP